MQSVCKFVTIILSIMRKIWIFFIIFVVALVAFTHALLHLLWAKTSNDANSDDDTNVKLAPDYPQNFAKALSATYFFMVMLRHSHDKFCIDAFF